MSKQKLKKISKELKKASNLHAGQAKKLDKMLESTSSPLKKISAACKAAAKRKFKVWPSAYASGWGVRCTRAGGPSRFGGGKKKMGKFQESDAPDAKGKFRDLSAPALASWMIKSRKGNLSKIISSLNQQVVFRRNIDPKYAAKMRRTMDIVRKRLGKKKK